MNSSQAQGSQVRLGQRASMRFNILVVGEGKIGKSTFLSALLSKYATSKVEVDEAVLHKTSGGGIKAVGTMALTPECQVHLFESVGFGDSINSTNSVQRIKTFLVSAHEKWNNMNWNRVTEQEMKNSDDRIHCIFYLLAPHKIKQLDIKFFEEMSSLAPIVPVVAKADSLTFPERKRCLLELNRHLVHISQKIGKQVVFDFKEDCGSDFLVDHHAAKSPANKKASANKAETMFSEQHQQPVSPAHQSEGGGSDASKVRSSEVSDSTSAVQRMLDPAHMATSTYVDVAHAALSDSVELPQTAAVQPTAMCGETAEHCEELPETLLHEHRKVLSVSISSDLFAAEDRVTLDTPRSDDEIQYGLSHLGESIGAMSFSSYSDHGQGTLPMMANIFAVVCATGPSEERVYPWGVVSINDDQLSDFRRLQRLVVESEHVTEMIRLTQQVSIRLAADRNRSPSAGSILCIYGFALPLWTGMSSECVGATAGRGGTSKDSRSERRVKALVDLTMLVGLLLVIGMAGSALYRLIFRTG